MLTGHKVLATMDENESRNLDVQTIRKDLKEWETAFNMVHRRKPAKEDIDQAPADIKEKYRTYYRIKKGNLSTQECNHDHKIKSPLQQSQSEVWGVELNKKPNKPKDGVKGDEKLGKVSSLEKLGSKLSMSVAATGFPLLSHSRDTSANKEKKFMRNPSSGLDTSAVTDHSLSKEESIREERKQKEEKKNVNTFLSSSHGEEFSLSGDIFKKAQKVMIMNTPVVCSSENSVSEIAGRFKLPKKSSLSSLNIDVSKFDTDISFDNRCSSNSSDNPSVVVIGSEKKLNPAAFANKSRPKSFDFGMTNIKDKDLLDEEKNVYSKTFISYSGDLKSNAVELSEDVFTAFDKEVKSPPKPTNNFRDSSSFIQTDKETVSNQEQNQTNGKSSVKRTRLTQRKRPADFRDGDSVVSSKKTKISDASNVTADSRNSNGFVSLDTHQVCPPLSSGVEDQSIPTPTTKAPLPSKSKPSSKSMNENYVCLNMKRRGYRRKGAGMTGVQLKRKLWKAKMASRSQSYGTNKCFKCGQEGHWANKCRGKGQKNSGATDPASSQPVEEGDFPSLREAALMSRGIKSSDPSQTEADADSDDITDVEASIVREFGDDWTTPPPCPSLDTVVTNIEQEMTATLSTFGLMEFREGQEASIGRILRGKSTLVVLATGGGKSLCYQLPAFLYGKHMKAITLVISPLVSLMEDQVTGLPPGVKGRCLHSAMPKSQQDSVRADLLAGNIHFLLVSPEAVVAGGRGSASCLPSPNQMPPVAFACIDEAHCLSEWSHNFRPSYLRVCRVLRRLYGITCFLGLTATATPSTCTDVARHLAIDDPNEATVRGGVVPHNLVLSVSRDENKDEALINLLQGPRFRSCPSIIIYCARRDQTTRVATLIRTSLQKNVELTGEEMGQPTESKSKKKSSRSKALPPFDPAVWTADSYHAGLTAAKRRSVQNAFMSGRLRVVVATVAFGMGLDKADVRAVLHYSPAKSYESYVQEIGRAGRDGLEAHCHAFIGQEEESLRELQRHTYANSVDRLTVKRLVHSVFPPCRCQEIYAKASESVSKDEAGTVICGGHERSLVIESTVSTLDIKEEIISTLLCYLELHYPDWLENLGTVYSRCRLSCYGGPSQLQETAKKSPPVAVAIARQKKEGKTFSDENSLEFDVLELCDVMGWKSSLVKRELKALQWTSGLNGWKKTGVTVEFDQLAFHFRSRGDFDNDVLDSVVNFLYDRCDKQEKTEISQLASLANALKSISHKNYWMCEDQADLNRSNRLKAELVQFFSKSLLQDDSFPSQSGDGGDGDSEMTAASSKNTQETEPPAHQIQALHQDIMSFLSLYGQEHQVTGRVVARIFHGIASPQFPAATWGRVRRFWRCHLRTADFTVILREAIRIIVRTR